MERYKSKFLENNNSNSIKFVNSLQSNKDSIYKIYEVNTYIADYDPNLDEIVSKYEKVDTDKKVYENSKLDDLIHSWLRKYDVNANYYGLTYTIENGYAVVRWYSYKDEPIAMKYGDKNFQYAMRNKKPLEQTLLVFTIKEERGI